MRVFVAGASGAIGRPLVPRLIAAGHEVTGMTRSEEKAEAVRSAGARAAVVDVFDADALRAAMAEAAPEVVVHQLTALPERMDFRKQELYTATNRLRTEGTRNLLDGGARGRRAPVRLAEHRLRLPERRIAREDRGRPAARQRARARSRAA